MKIYKNTISKGEFNLDIDDFYIEYNNITCILGENGSGKSTLCKALASKTIKCDANIITLLNQKPYIYSQKVISIVSKVISWNKTNISVDEFLEKYDLASKKNISVKKLSGGEFRRLSLGLILCTNSELLILDEPFVGIDVKSQKEIMKILLEEKNKRTIILVSHKMSICKKLCNRFIFMNKGKIIENSNKDEFFKSENIEVNRFLEMIN